ncbi:MAG TPA: xanthine dehydrogenase family protein subunit M, partial [Candidatus Eisenbacteria bacterium]|nr:xanthine dehydrogenase family protein subunit M [Candidatus Eisenbacteria bacterium]
GTCRAAAIGITGVTDKPYRATRVEQMLAGNKLEAGLIERAAEDATSDVDVIEDINGSSAYRAHLTRVYVARAIGAALAA